MKEEAVIYSRGTQMSEVPPEFRGISVGDWRRRRDRLNLELAAKNPLYSGPADRHPLNKKAIWKPANSYGMKSV